MKKKTFCFMGLIMITLLVAGAFFLGRNMPMSKRQTKNTEDGVNLTGQVGTSTGTSSSMDLFVRVDGEKLVDEAGNVVRIKSIGFGNNVWENPGTPTRTHHDEESYREISDLGFNAVRFYLNYKIFEDDAEPYVYKEEGFEWLDENIEWARANGIRLVLNMHLPQGGFISSKSVSFWENEENISRYMALWREIAKRYADEPAVLGYGLMNEPFIPGNVSADVALIRYYNLIENVAREIREVDAKHILFVERPYGMVDKNKNVNYAWGDTGSFRCISDKNVVYEFHFYEYTNFTSQGISWSSFERDWYYGDDSIALLSGKREYFAVCKEDSLHSYDDGRGGWQLLESPMYDMTAYPKADAAYFVLYFSNLTKDAEVYIDDIVVKEYDSNGEFIREVYRHSFDNVTECSGWDLGAGTGGKCLYTAGIGHDGNGCELITEVGGQFRMYKNENMYNYFPIKDGHKYQVSCWVRADDAEKMNVQPGLQLLNVENVYALNKEFLESKLLTYISLGKQYKVPIYIGEFGTTSHIMGNEFGGEEWVSDVFDILNQYEIHYSYHDYHEENYGLYRNPSTKIREQLNEHLLQVFKRKVKG